VSLPNTDVSDGYYSLGYFSEDAESDGFELYPQFIGENYGSDWEHDGDGLINSTTGESISEDELDRQYSRWKMYQ